MSRVARSVLTVFLVSFSGCDADKPAIEPNIVSGLPPLPPPRSLTVDCNTLTFAKTSEVDALPGGLWSGSLDNCQNNVAHDYVTALVSEDGRFRIIGENGKLLWGTLHTDGDVFIGYGLVFAADSVKPVRAAIVA